MIGDTVAAGVGALLVLIGVGAGAAWSMIHVVAEERERREKAVKAICGCGHHYSYHKDGGVCWRRVEEGYVPKNMPCGCQRYVGPRVEDAA